MNNQSGQIKQNYLRHHGHCYVRSTVNDVCIHTMSNKVMQTNNVQTEKYYDLTINKVNFLDCMILSWTFSFDFIYPISDKLSIHFQLNLLFLLC